VRIIFNLIIQFINNNNYKRIVQTFIFKDIQKFKEISKTMHHTNILTLLLKMLKQNIYFQSQLLNENEYLLLKKPLHLRLFYNYLIKIIDKNPFIKNINNNDNIDNEKTFGFYKNTIETRIFNEIITTKNNTIKKISKDLSGEIYYYKNIPIELKYMFPLFLQCDDIKNTWYEMENIHGIPISKLYVSEELSLKQFQNIMNTLNKLHTFPVSNSINITIYGNYINKLKERYEKYDYSKFVNHQKIYTFLYTKLTIYERKNRGKISIIHGDPVFTNILIQQSENIKFIDMRGMIDKKLTIYGDIFYDYAKIYQSLIGYDEILENKFISNHKYKQRFLHYFKNMIIKKFGKKSFYYVKIISASLLFTLIPLHDNDNCFQYYDLINTLLPSFRTKNKGIFR
jgi:aminoglycoside phosphotransferase